MKNNFQKSGFTLVETLVAIAILTLAVAGPLYTASRAIVAAETARDQLIASYLAQEGIEYVRKMRDNEFLAAFQIGGANISTDAWTGFLAPGPDPASIAKCVTLSVGSAPFCTLDPVGSGSLSLCISGTCNPLNLTTVTVNGKEISYYTQGAGTATPFTRKIQAYTVSPIDEEIISTVSWTFHNTNYWITVTDHLTPWQ